MRYQGTELEAVEAAKKIQRLDREKITLRKARSLLPEEGAAAKEITDLLFAHTEEMAQLRPLATGRVTCHGCGGAGREGHGESCGACGGGRTVPAWLAAGTDPL